MLSFSAGRQVSNAVSTYLSWLSPRSAEQAGTCPRRRRTQHGESMLAGRDPCRLCCYPVTKIRAHVPAPRAFFSRRHQAPPSTQQAVCLGEPCPRGRCPRCGSKTGTFCSSQEIARLPSKSSRWPVMSFTMQVCRLAVPQASCKHLSPSRAEISHAHGFTGLPTVSCFIPSLPAGTPFQVSIHSWSGPTVSQFTRSYSKYSDAVKFEARLFLDGRLVAYALLWCHKTQPSSADCCIALRPWTRRLSGHTSLPTASVGPACSLPSLGPLPD